MKTDGVHVTDGGAVWRRGRIALSWAVVMLWGIPAIALAAAGTALCVALLFAPPFVLLAPVCSSALALVGRAVAGRACRYAGEWRACGIHPPASRRA